MQFETNTSGLVNDAPGVSTLMKKLLIALIPAIAVSFYFYGWGVLINLTLAIIFSLLLESVMLLIRKRAVMIFIGDYSAIVTACLVALALPPLITWWIPLVGLVFSIVIAKHCYGGLGYNPFNPAMVAYAVLIISFPLEMSQWPSSDSTSHGWGGLTQSLSIVFNHVQPAWDAITQATPLDLVRGGMVVGKSYTEVSVEHSFSWASTQEWQWISCAYFAGGVYLIKQRVIRWHIPVSVLLSLFAIASIFWLFDHSLYASPLFHLLSGATMIGAFFIATDPVTSCVTPLGQLIYGASVGCFIYIIRAWGAYPDSVAFAVLIMNMAVPLIDYYTQPRVFGHPSLLDRMNKR